MSDNFGALTDYFGIATSDLLLVDVPTVAPIALSVERSADEDGDFLEEASHGQNANGNLVEVSSVYELKSGSISLAGLKLGYFASGVAPLVNRIITSIEVSTSNQQWPQITVNGLINAHTPAFPTGSAVGDKLLTYTLPAFTIYGRKQAQLIGFSIDPLKGRLVKSTLSATAEIDAQTNGIGVICAHSVHGGVITVTCEQVRLSTGAAAPEWTKPTNYIETQTGSSGEPKAGFHAWEFAAETILARDVVLATTTTTTT